MNNSKYTQHRANPYQNRTDRQSYVTSPSYSKEEMNDSVKNSNSTQINANNFPLSYSSTSNEQSAENGFHDYKFQHYHEQESYSYATPNMGLNPPENISSGLFYNSNSQSMIYHPYSSVHEQLLNYKQQVSNEFIASPYGSPNYIKYAGEHILSEVQNEFKYGSKNIVNGYSSIISTSFTNYPYSNVVNINQPIVDFGNRLLDSSKNVLLKSSLTYADIGARGVHLTGNIMKNGLISTHNVLNSTVSNTFSQMNRYTPDIYDVGGYGRKDLTSDMGLFMLGNSAMIAQNTVRMARMPASFALKGLNAVVYNERRLGKIKEKSESLLSENPISKLRYTEIATGHSQRDILLQRDRLAWNRFKKNEAFDLDIKEKTKFAYVRMRANRYNRVLNRSNGIQKYSTYLRKKQFSLTRSGLRTVSNQTRKLTNAIIRGNDPESMTNKTMFYMNKGLRGGTRAAKIAWRKRIYARRMGSAILHPIRTVKAMIRSVLTAMQTLSAFISAIPVVVSFVALLTPVLIVIICVCLILVTLFGWYMNTHGFTYAEMQICDTNSKAKTYECSNAITDRSSESWKMFHENTHGEMKTDELGFHYIELNGVKFFTVAMSTYYSGGNHVGAKYRVTLEGNKTFHVIIADIKQNAHTHPGNVPVTQYCLAGANDMIEFILNKSIAEQAIGVSSNGYIGGGSLNKDFDSNHPFKGIITKIERAIPKSGDLEGSPDFSNRDAWLPPSNVYANAPIPLYGQCTWFAWGRFYEIYGYSPGFSGHGYQCVRQLLNAHPDKFEFGLTPKPGAVGSSDINHNHVWIVVGVDGNNITIQEGNVDGKTNTFEEAQSDWRTVTRTLDELRSIYGAISFANPI